MKGKNVMFNSSLLDQTCDENTLPSDRASLVLLIEPMLERRIEHRIRVHFRSARQCL